MRVALLAPDGAVVATLAEALRRRGIDVQVLAARAERRRPGSWRALTGQWRELRRAAREAVAAGADLVHAHSWAPAGVAAPAGVPLVLTVHPADAALLRTSRLARKLARPVFERARVVTAVSREVGDWTQNAVGRHVGREHVQRVPIDVGRWPWTSGGRGAVIVAELVAPQRVDLAIQTVGVLASCGHGLPLTIIGDGPLRPELEVLTRNVGVEALVRFIGTVPADEVQHHLVGADLMLHTAQADPTASGVLHALMTGVPVVACWDGGATVELVPEKGAGRLTLPSPDALADAALDILTDPDRLDAGRSVGESWRARVAPDHVAEVCEGWYRDAIGR